ncbi:MAG TPA: HNH endonuclease family protein, partial [Nitrososphaera sp.]|nr:HNH endonuclease family protein [Nitrososphaera sp.]
GEVKTAKELANKMVAIVPDDITFEQAFRIHQVSKVVTARYYLHSLENFKRGETKPQIGYWEVPENSTNLEHIMPDRECEGWDISVTEAQAHYKRLGNMTLLAAKLNSKIGSSSFAQKKKVYANSTFLLTQEVAEYKDWGPKQVDKRQIELATIVPKVWPL